MLFKNLRIFLEKNSHEGLPPLPSSILDWIPAARPNVAGTLRDFQLEPFWFDVYKDEHPNIMVINGRQTFKTTFCTDVLAWFSTTHPNCEVSYVIDNDAHLSAFSKQRLRRETFIQNPVLSEFLPHGRANVREIALRNGSIIYLLTDENQFNKVEGRSNKILILDEAQYQEIQFLPKALYTLSQTRGRLFILGIGGEAGSEYHKLWNRTDQREWIYKDMNWRQKLRFNSEGNIINEHPENILAGRWVAQKPENKKYRGYHMSQEIFARIPLTIDDAIYKYHMQPGMSIEYQRKHFPNSIYVSHTLGEFYKAERRPITPEMVQACYVNWLTLQKPQEVCLLKEIYGNEIRVVMGIDFGSGPAASQTIVSIIIHWRKSNRYQLAWIEGRPQEHQLDQARYLAELGNSYKTDFGVGDLGYGQIQVKSIQDGGRDSKDNKFKGLGKRRFVGCRSIGDETKPQMEFRQETDEHGTQLGRVQIDKTTSIQKFVDFIGSYVSHPILSDEKWKRPKFMIPMKNDYETDWLLDDFCSITRKDLESSQDVTSEDPRQNARKEFNHPPDSVMSIIYALVADENYDEGAFRIYPVGRK